jgi:hypothetical protein
MTLKKHVCPRLSKPRRPCRCVSFEEDSIATIHTIARENSDVIQSGTLIAVRRPSLIRFSCPFPRYQTMRSQQHVEIDRSALTLKVRLLFFDQYHGRDVQFVDGRMINEVIAFCTKHPTGFSVDTWIGKAGMSKKN